VINPAGTLKLSPAIGVFIARAVRAPLWLLVSALLARVLSPEGLGTWAMILAAAMLGNQVLLLWTQAITQKFGREEFLEDGALNRTWSYRWPWIILGFFVSGVLVILLPFDWHLKYYGLDNYQRWLIIPVIIGLWMMGEVQGLQQVRERYSSLAWAPVVADMCFLLLISFLFLFGHYFHNLDQNTILLAVSCTSLIVWMGLLRRELHGMRCTWTSLDITMMRKATLFALPLIPGFVIGYLAEWCDYFLIGHFYNSQTVGLFHPAYQYMLIMVGMPAAFTAVLLPQIAAIKDSGKKSQLIFLANRLSPQLLVIWGLLAFFAISILPLIFGFMVGENYAESNKILRVLLISVPGAVVVHIYGLAYFMQGRLYVSNILLYGIKLIANFLISFSLLPHFGVLGSAIGSSISYLILQWIFLYEQHRYININMKLNSVILLLAQIFSIALSCIQVDVLRVFFAIVAVFILMMCAKKFNFFTNEEIDLMIPKKIKFTAPIMKKILCRNF
jgi:O-antigen/teichoic acid export membrane protein